MDDEFGEVGEDRIEAAERTAGILGDLARPEVCKPLSHNPASCRIDQPRPQIFAFFFSFPGH